MPLGKFQKGLCKCEGVSLESPKSRDFGLFGGRIQTGVRESAKVRGF